jgi:hypothetical protein
LVLIFLAKADMVCSYSNYRFLQMILVVESFLV